MKKLRWNELNKAANLASRLGKRVVDQKRYIELLNQRGIATKGAQLRLDALMEELAASQAAWAQLKLATPVGYKGRVAQTDTIARARIAAEQKSTHEKTAQLRAKRLEIGSGD